jgi:hypothetical protein
MSEARPRVDGWARRSSIDRCVRILSVLDRLDADIRNRCYRLILMETRAGHFQLNEDIRC